jgi:hypothetical protein
MAKISDLIGKQVESLTREEVEAHLTCLRAEREQRHAGKAAREEQAPAAALAAEERARSVDTTTRGDVIARSLLNKTTGELEARIGKPAKVDRHRLTYVVSGEQLLVYINDNNVVVDVQPPTFDLTLFGKQ